MRAIALMVRRGLRHYALSTTVTVVAVALACGLMISVFSINAQTYEAFTDADVGFDAVLGARGSQLQLVLNSVYHLETSPGNIPWSLYRAIANDPRVEHAVPYALGDNYFGHRIVGTTLGLFEVVRVGGRPLAIEPDGRPFDVTRREAVVGSFVAQEIGLGVGDTFQPYHGLAFDENMQHREQYLVTGVLRPTNTPMDRVIWIPIEGVFRMEGHVLRGSGDETFEPRPGQDIPDEHKEVSAVMLVLSDPQAGFSLEQTINRQGKVATLAWPIGRVMAELFDKLGWTIHVLRMVAYVVVAVATSTVLATLYNTINERRREFAILRALGARRRTVFGAVVAESACIAAVGAVLGLLVYAIIVAVAAQVIRSQTGVVLVVLYFHPVLIWGPLAMTALGALAGIVPAAKAYATDVAEHLAPHT